MIPKEQLEQLRQNVLQQVETNIPPENREAAKQQIMSMSDEQFIQFLKQNNLIKDDGSAPQPQEQQCIFCSIVSEKVPSYKIDENKDSIAILELNPVSKGHVLIIPKEHIESSDKLPKTVFTLAKKIAKKLTTKFKPKDVTIVSSNVLGHEIVNVFPVYENENINSPKEKASEEDLFKLQNLLQVKRRPPTVRKARTKKIKDELWLPKRIP